MINDYEATKPMTVDAENVERSGYGGTVDNDTVISTLNNLIETCRDGQKGVDQCDAQCRHDIAPSLRSRAVSCRKPE